MTTTNTTASIDLAQLDKLHVECRECGNCGHVGINDSSDTQAACHNCDWTGAEPSEDHCPGCAQTNCMGAACPKCGALYQLLADTVLARRSLTSAAPAEQICEKNHGHPHDYSLRDDGTCAWCGHDEESAGAAAKTDHAPIDTYEFDQTGVPTLDKHGDWVKLSDHLAAMSASAAGAGSAQPAALGEQLCPACQGSGEGLMMEGAGPDAYEVPCTCPYCKGSGGLLDAYNGLVELLAAEREKYLQLCGKEFWAKSAPNTQQAGAAASSREAAPLDCRTPAGVTVGLIDGIIAMARVLRQRDLSAPDVVEALKDIRQDEDVAALARAPLPAHPVQDGEKDAARLDWLNQNFFSDQKDEWDERLAPDSIKWKFFGPMSIQGDVRRVIDAAMAAAQQDAKGEKP